MLAGILLMALSLILVLTGCSTTTPAATPTPTLKVSPTPAATLAPTPIASPTPASTPKPTPIASPTSAPTATPATAQAKVDISGFAFVPQTLTVAVGTTVTWTNNDSSSHTIASNDNLFQSGTLAKGSTFSHTFGQKGTFNYHCSIHPSMTGKIVVE
jgi:plastocyanin